MSVTITTSYWLKEGDVARPFISTIKTNDQTGIILSSSNLPTSPPDVEISQAQHDQYVQDISDAILAAETASVIAKWENKEAQKATAEVKLLALGLTQEEIDVLFGF